MNLAALADVVYQPVGPGDIGVTPEGLVAMGLMFLIVGAAVRFMQRREEEVSND